MNNTSITIGGSIGGGAYATRRARATYRGRSYGAVQYREGTAISGRPRATRRVRV